MNKVILVGRLVKDPEIRRTANDIPVVQFTIAVNRIALNRNGEKQADFISCVVWRQLAENLAKYMRKGSQIGVEGQLQVRTYDDPSGQRRYITEVICDMIHYLEPKKDSLYNDVNKYDIPEVRRDYNQRNEPTKPLDFDPFQRLNSDTYVPSNDDSRNDSNTEDDDIFKNINSSSVSDDDLPF